MHCTSKCIDDSLKHEMVNLDLNEFSTLDDILADMKLTPEKVEIPIPSYLIQVPTHAMP